MNKLIKINNDADLGLVVSSRTVAEELGKQHKHVLESIYKLINDSTADISALFILSEYQATNGKMNKEYLLTKDGFTLYMFNIQGHNDFKMEYINKFNEMEQAIKEKHIHLPSDPMEVLELVFKANKKTDEEVKKIKSDVIDLKENVKLDAAEYGFIGKQVQERVTVTIKKFGYSNNSKVRSELLKNLNGDIKRIAKVSTRSQLKQKHFDMVLDFIKTWEPSSATQYDLRQIEAELRGDLNVTY